MPRCAARAISSAWLKPRERIRNLCAGTGIISNSATSMSPFQLQAGFGRQPPQRMGSRPHPLILEQMDELAQHAPVGSIVDRAFECRTVKRSIRRSTRRHRPRRPGQAGRRKRCSGPAGLVPWIACRRRRPEGAKPRTRRSGRFGSQREIRPQAGSLPHLQRFGEPAVFLSVCCPSYC